MVIVDCSTRVSPCFVGSQGLYLELFRFRSDNFEKTPRIKRRWKVLLRASDGVSDLSDRGYYGQFLEYPSNHDTCRLR